MPKGGPRKAKDPKKTLLRLLSYLKQYTPTLIIVVLCIFTVAFASITGSTAAFSTNAIDTKNRQLRNYVRSSMDVRPWLIKAY